MPPKRPSSSSSLTGAPPAVKRRAMGISTSATRRIGVAIKSEPSSSSHGSNNANNGNNTDTQEERLKEEFIALFSLPQYKHGGVSNSQLKNIFKERYSQLPLIINDFIKESRLTMSKVGNELYYNFVAQELASKFTGLDVSARMVYQLIEKSNNKGIWTKDIRIQSNIQQQALNKIFKKLEDRRLIKPVKAITAKAKKLYMLFDLQPAKELTGGPWYSDLEFDHEFVSELRTFVMLCVRKMNGGKGVSLKEIANKMLEANVSRVQLNLSEVQQLVQTLAFDYMIEQNGMNLNGDALFAAARKCSSCCDFKWWDVIDDDFHFRDMQFEDGVVLSKHEPHHHTAS